MGYEFSVLIEKILRTVPDVGKIFLLIKAKSKEAAMQRLKNEVSFVSNLMFSNFKYFGIVFVFCFHFLTNTKNSYGRFLDLFHGTVLKIAHYSESTKGCFEILKNDLRYKVKFLFSETVF